MKKRVYITAAAAIGLVLLVFAVYWPALHGGFIWDDDDYITKNLSLQTLHGLQQIWVNPDATLQYYPLTFTVFWLEYHRWGLDPIGYHTVNVLLQAVNALLLWRLLSRLRVPGAGLAAIIFAIHPVEVMSVAWMTELKNVLSGAFYLGALLAYARFSGLDEPGHEPDSTSATSDPSSGDRRWRYYGLTLFLFLCALLSKTSTSVLPLAALLLLWWKGIPLRRATALSLVPLFGLAACFGLVTVWVETHLKGATGVDFVLSPMDRVWIAGKSFWFCLGKLFWPADLTFIYPRWPTNPGSVLPYLYPLAAVALLALLWFARKRVGRAPLAVVVYFAACAPALVLFHVLFMMRYSFVSDHWQYLGSMAVIAWAVATATIGCRKIFPGNHWPGMAVAALVVALLAGLSWKQAHVYRDLETLWRDTISKNPAAWMAHDNLGVCLAEQGKLDDAVHEHELALAIKPDNAFTHNNLGAALEKQGKHPEAIAQYREAARLDRHFAEPYINLGQECAAAGDTDQAIGFYEKAIAIEPQNAKAHYNLGTALASKGERDEAIDQFRQALRFRPEFAEARDNLALALASMGKIDEAIDQFGESLRIRPDDAKTHYNFAVILAGLGRTTEAMAHYFEAIRLKPDYAEAHNNMGLLLASQGRWEEAIRQYRLALRARPNSETAQVNLGLALAAVGQTDEAIVHFRGAVLVNPNRAETHLSLAAAWMAKGNARDAVKECREALRCRPAWPLAETKLARILATDPDPSVREGSEAVRLALDASQQTGDRQPESLDALAAAYAETGRFEEAIAATRKAIQIASQTGDKLLARQIEQRLALYQAGRAFHTALRADGSPP